MPRVIINNVDYAGRSHSSKNLRGVLEHARRRGVDTVQIAMTEDYGAKVYFAFSDGAWCKTEFQSYDVAQRWIRARRSWGLTSRTITPTYEAWKGDIGELAASASFDRFPAERLPALPR